jgi:hypothetical protein
MVRVSKQRQEYKNLLKGKSSRLNDSRITRLNEIGFAWQLQRGGRRRQLKAKDKMMNRGNHEGDGTDGGSTASEVEDNDEPCILPGEVLIGSGSGVPLSTSNGSSPNLEPGTNPIEQGPSSSLCASLPQPLAQQSGSLLTPSSSLSAMHRLGRGAEEDNLLRYMLARNILLQSGTTATNLTALQMLRGGPSFARVGLPAAGVPGRANLLQSSGRPDGMLSGFPPRASPVLRSLGAGSLEGAGSTGLTNSSTWRFPASVGVPTTAPWYNSFASRQLGSVVQSARLGESIGPSNDTTMLSDAAPVDIPKKL